MPVAVERADDIAAAVQPEQCGVASVGWGRSPFRPDPVRRHRLNRDVRRNLVLECTRIHVLASLYSSERTRLASFWRSAPISVSLMSLSRVTLGGANSPPYHDPGC